MERDVTGVFSSRGGNLIGIADTSHGFENQVNGDWVGTPSNAIDPKLAALSFNGGVTKTIALLSGSLAIDNGTAENAPLIDQRGYRRDTKPDIGAFEYGANTSVDQETEVSGTKSLSPNYPNPFNPVTRIRFSLPRPSRVTLRIFSILGEEMETLIDGRLEAQIHEISWSASGYASGIYLYRLEAGELVETKKLTVLR